MRINSINSINTNRQKKQNFGMVKDIKPEVKQHITNVLAKHIKEKLLYLESSDESGLIDKFNNAFIELKNNQAYNQFYDIDFGIEKSDLPSGKTLFANITSKDGNLVNKYNMSSEQKCIPDSIDAESFKILDSFEKVDDIVQIMTRTYNQLIL